MITNEILSEYIAIDEQLEKRAEKMAELLHMLNGPTVTDGYYEVYEALQHFRKLREHLRTMKPKLELI